MRSAEVVDPAVTPDTFAAHLGMAPGNTGARAFYNRLGFIEIPVGDPHVVYLGRRITPL
jgi:hypothetical protein